jgi:hypothetical protein
MRRYVVESGSVKVIVSEETQDDALWEFLIRVRDKGWMGKLGWLIRVLKSRKLTDQYLYHTALALWSTSQISWSEACEMARVDPFSGHKIYSRMTSERLLKVGAKSLPWVPKFRRKTEPHI